MASSKKQIKSVFENTCFEYDFAVLRYEPEKLTRYKIVQQNSVLRVVEMVLMWMVQIFTTNGMGLTNIAIRLKLLINKKTVLSVK